MWRGHTEPYTQNVSCLKIQLHSLQFLRQYTQKKISYAQTRPSLAPLNDISTETVTVVVFWDVMPCTLLDT